MNVLGEGTVRRVSRETPAARPIYEIHALPSREVVREFYSREPVEDATGKRTGRSTLKVEKRTEVIEAGFLVFFPSGHSVAFDTEKDMNAAGVFLNNNTQIDEDGEVIVPRAQRSLRAMSEAREVTRARRTV